MVQRKNITTARSRNTSRRMKSATVGTHIKVPHSSKHMNADQVGFSSPRKQKRATRGMVSNVRDLGSAGGKKPSRVGQRDFGHELQAAGTRRRILLLVIVLALAILVAVVVGLNVWYQSLGSNVSFRDSDATSALTAVSNEDPSYTLVSVSLDEPVTDESQPQALLLVRVAKEEPRVSVLSIPANIEITRSDGTEETLARTAKDLGDAALIQGVSKLLGCSINHFVKIDARGISELTDAMGGVGVQVVEEIDDPSAGDIYIATGEQTLDGASALVYLRASNFSKGIDQQQQNIRDYFAQMLMQMVRDGSKSLFVTLEATHHPFETDLTARSLEAFANSIAGISAGSFIGAQVPGYETSNGAMDYYAVSTGELSALMTAYKTGQPLEEDEEGVEVYAPESFTLTIRNGAGITGAAASMETTLEGLGYNVTEIGNTDTDAYDETLIIYNDDSMRPAAQAVLNTLGMGRIVFNELGYYSFGSDVLLVIGKDWKPLD